MRRLFFEISALILLLASLALFYRCLTYLDQRDYVASILTAFVGFAVIRTGGDLARMALVRRE